MKLFDYQKRAVRKLVDRQGVGGLWMEPGTGKTRTALEIVRKLVPRPRVLAVVPLSVVGPWRREVKAVMPNLATYNATAGTVAQRREIVEGVSEGLVLVGYETYWREPLRRAIYKEFQPDAVIYDEAHRIKGAGTRQSRMAHFLAGATPKSPGPRVPIRLGLSGTPMPNGPRDLYSVYKGLDPTVFGTRLDDFDDRYVRYGGYMGYEIKGYKHLKEIERKLNATSFRITKDEALDLPETMDVQLDVTLSPKTRKVYNDMRAKAIARLKEGVAVARTAFTAAIRLQQISSGFAKVAEGTLVDLSVEKIDCLCDLLSDLQADRVPRVVVFCRFRHDIDRIADTLERRFPKINLFVLDGRVHPDHREGLIDTFKAMDGVMIAQVAVASLGIDLTCANVGVFYSADYNLTNYTQSRDRLHRIGQTQKVTYYHIVADDTLDAKIYEALARKENLSRRLLSRPLEIL